MFAERARPPWPLLAIVGAAAFTWAQLSNMFADDWWRSVLFAATLPAFGATYVALIVVRVTNGAVTWATRLSGPSIPIGHLTAVRILTGPALKECRTRNTPSFRTHCPVWERVGIQLVTDGSGGRRTEHLVAVRDVGAFVDAVGRPDLVTYQHDTPVAL